jgi:hypothetical protein
MKCFRFFADSALEVAEGKRNKGSAVHFSLTEDTP